MKKINIISAIFLLTNVFAIAQKPDNLRCEYLINPIGVDAVSPRLTWLIDDSRQGALQQAYRLVVDTDSNKVVTGNGGIWDSQKILSDDMLVAYKGIELKPFTKYFWKVEIWDKDNTKQTSDVASFETGMIYQKNWKGSWIADGQDIGGNGIGEKKAPYFRHEFNVNKKIRSARAYIAVAGLYELTVNGKRIGDHRLDPMYTRFDRRNLYVTYDVTSQIQQGKNALGVLLGNGWYNHQSTAVWFFDRAPWRNRPTFCMDLRITYDDGSVETVSTERDWKTSLSPLIFNSIYTAEHYDARLEQPGWDNPGFDDSKWANAIRRPAPSQNIVSQQLHPIRNVEEVKVKSIKKIDDRTWWFDFGRNIAGVTQFSVSGEAGTTFRLMHGERLNKDGRIDMSNIDEHYRPTDDSDPFQTDIYILNGKGKESFMPRFNYKGFQYVEVTCDKPVTLTADNLTAWFMHSDLPPVGKIETSNQTINKIWWATNNSYLSNFFGYPTDCPHREKNGWTGDGQIAVETGLYNFDGITVYEKWLADHRDEQQPNGVLPAIIPTSGWGYFWANGLDWTSTIAIIPWNVYLFYGDSRLLSDCYDNIKRYVDHVTDISPDGLTDWGLGDWIPVKSTTPVEFTSSVYYFVDATILANAAKLFNEQADYEKYSRLAEKIKNAINAKYLNRETGIYCDGVQTAQSVPLQWGIVPDDMKAKVAEQLAARVKADNNHLDVGLLGTKAILNALGDNGYADLAYTLAAQETYPSWGWWIVNGATTLYENWPIDTRSLSLNHIMFGEIGAWFYKSLGGIKPDPAHPGFKNILLSPQFVKDLQKAEVSHKSPYGTITSKWQRKGNTVIYDVVIPANSTATLYIPKGYSVKKALAGGEKYNINKDSDSYNLQSGSYTFYTTKTAN